MRGKCAWKAAVAEEFAAKLIRTIKQINADYEGEKTSEYYRQVADETLALINETYEDVYDATPDDEEDDEDDDED